MYVFPHSTATIWRRISSQQSRNTPPDERKQMGGHSQDGPTSLGAMNRKDSPTSFAYPAYLRAEFLQMSWPPPPCCYSDDETRITHHNTRRRVHSTQKNSYDIRAKRNVVACGAWHIMVCTVVLKYTTATPKRHAARVTYRARFMALKILEIFQKRVRRYG